MSFFWKTCDQDYVATYQIPFEYQKLFININGEIILYSK